MKGIAFFSAALFLFFLTDSFAESIRLKSGKNIEGKIIKETDDGIIADVGGVSINYYFDEIESIDGKKISSAGLPADKGKPSGQRNISDKNITLSWEEWYKSIRGYLDKFDEISKKSQALSVEQNEKLQKTKDRQLQKKIFLEGNEALAKIFDEFETLKPPQELANFHSKLIESYGYVKKINAAVLRDDDDSVAAYNQIVNSLTLEAFTELKNLYIKYGAPQNKIEPLDRIIAKYLEYGRQEKSNANSRESLPAAGR